MNYENDHRRQYRRPVRYWYYRSGSKDRSSFVGWGLLSYTVLAKKHQQLSENKRAIKTWRNEG